MILKKIKFFSQNIDQQLLFFEGNACNLYENLKIFYKITQVGRNKWYLNKFNKFCFYPKNTKKLRKNVFLG